jgi:uncharacterized membrane protein YfcA
MTLTPFAKDLLLLVAALGAGAQNSVAGGGSFLTFPALVYAGVPSITANASSTVALAPASFASAWAYRHDFKPFPGIGMTALIGCSLVGSLLGAILLLVTPQRTFDDIIPWLLGAATLIFAFGRQVSDAAQRIGTLGPRTMLAFQFLIAVYGGYFGGAIGILMLALYGLLGLTDLHAMNAMKTLIAGLLNTVAIIAFVIAGKVSWPETILMLAAALIGGYGGARIARRVKPIYLRIAVIGIGCIMTTVFFLRS